MILSQSPSQNYNKALSGGPLKVLIGDYPHTAAMKSGALRSEWLDVLFIAAKPLNSAFKRMVRDLEFDISELSLATFLQAKDAGKPLVLLPYVMMSRFQHPYLVYNSDRGPLLPEQLSGRTIGCRLYTANTAVWLRFILERDYAVDLDSLRWIALQKPHVAEFRDPPNVHEAFPDSDLLELLLSGAADAIVIDPVPVDPRIRTVIPDPGAAAKRWTERNGGIQINHMLVATEEICRVRPEAVREFYRVLVESTRAGNREGDIGRSGLEANRHNIDLAIDCVYAQGLISQRFRVDDLFNGVTASLR
jgi:4,5-dihydroxyphthalate decarboxylase